MRSLSQLPSTGSPKAVKSLTGSNRAGSPGLPKPKKLVGNPAVMMRMGQK